MNAKACLFGGALMAAGLSANAQQFIYQASSPDAAYSSFAYSSAYGGSIDVAYGPDALNTLSSGYTAYTGTTTLATHQTSTSMSATAQWAGDGFAGYGYGMSLVQQFFQVSSNAQLLIEWDLSGTDGYAGALVLEDASGNALFMLDPLGGDAYSGSMTIDLLAGVDYVAIFGFQDFLSSGFGPYVYGTDLQHITMSLVPVPTPGSAGLLAAGGLLAARRRRR